jgi:hypothetical protein
MRPRPERSGASALPSTAPVARSRSPIRMACPRHVEVVSRSPATIGACVASAKQNTLPIKAIGARSRPVSRRSRIRPDR